MEDQGFAIRVKYNNEGRDEKHLPGLSDMYLEADNRYVDKDGNVKFKLVWNTYGHNARFFFCRYDAGEIIDYIKKDLESHHVDAWVDLIPFYEIRDPE